MAAFTVIDHTELSGNATSYTVSSISASYDHLYLVASARSDTSVYIDFCQFEFNTDTTGSNYSTTWLDASTTTPTSNRATTYAHGGFVPDASSTASTFGATTLWIPNYANTTNFKQSILSSSVTGNTSTNNEWIQMLAANLWHSTAAINEVKWFTSGGDNFVQYSTFTLYGVTGA
jgi:hypothetical protein